MVKQKNETKRRNGFTLVELLVVVAIIALLVSILLPTLSKAKELAKRSVCMSSANAIGKSFMIYALDFGDKYPFVALNGGNCQTYVGHNRAWDIYHTGAIHHSNSTNLWLLCYTEYANVNMFICPSAKHVADSSTVTDFSDFTARENVSYGFQLPYNSRTAATEPGPGVASGDMPESIPIMADRSPYMTATGAMDFGATITDWDSDPSEVQRKAGNSPNHGGEGQTVLFTDSHVTFYDQAGVGVDGDNIYTAASGTNETSPAGTLNVPNSDKDSMIAP